MKQFYLLSYRMIRAWKRGDLDDGLVIHFCRTLQLHDAMPAWYAARRSYDAQHFTEISHNRIGTPQTHSQNVITRPTFAWARMQIYQTGNKYTMEANFVEVPR